MPCPHVTGVRYHVYRIEMIELVADIPDLGYPFFVLIGNFIGFSIKIKNNGHRVFFHFKAPCRSDYNKRIIDFIMKQGGTTAKIVPGKS